MDWAPIQSIDFYVDANGHEILDREFTKLSTAESFFHNDVIDLGHFSRSNLDLTFGYSLTANGNGGFGTDFVFGRGQPIGAVPEPSTWAMMLIGFAGLGFASYRRSRKDAAAAYLPIISLRCVTRQIGSCRSRPYA
jgi:hypothetical protein